MDLNGGIGFQSSMIVCGGIGQSPGRDALQYDRQLDDAIYVRNEMKEEQEVYMSERELRDRFIGKQKPFLSGFNSAELYGIT